MIKINSYSKKFEQEYVEYIKGKFKRAISNSLKPDSIRNKVINKKYELLYIKYFNSINENLELILISKLDKLIELNEKIWSENIDLKTLLDNSQKEKCNFDDICKKIFNYKDKLSNDTKFAYKISKNSSVNVCPYCNINYTYTISDDKNEYIRPEFDHFLPKDKYPIFSLSLYNLVPCCHSCNHQKSNTNFSLNNNLYPYNEGLQKEKVFSHKIISINQYEVMIINENKKFKNNKDIFHLDEIYIKSFNNIINRKHKIAEMYCRNYLDSLKNIDNSLKIDYIGEILRKTDEIKNTSLGKMSNDIIDEIIFDLNEL